MKALKIESLQRDLEKLESQERLHICFGSRKLFNAQHHLAANGYTSREEWLDEWRKKRSGRFYCVGKSHAGGGTMMKVFALNDAGEYRLNIRIPRCLRAELGEWLCVLEGQLSLLCSTFNQG